MKAFASDKFFRALTAAVLMCAMLITMCACTRAEPAGTPETTEETTSEIKEPDAFIRMPYTELDSLNPFVCTSILNSSIISLIYRSLYYLDNSLTPQRDLAAAENITSSQVRIDIPTDLVFSDGSALTSSDVAYSFNKAAASPLYKEQLKGISSCETNGSGTAVFNLTAPDINILNVFTFPVVKSGTAENNDSRPIGCGCYQYTPTESRLTLTCNMKYAGSIPKIGTVRLYDTADSSSLVHMLDIGDIDCFYTDLSDGSAKRIYSSVIEIYLNNLIFLGINQGGNYRLQSSEIRKALSLALDRQGIVDSAFLGHARIAVTPFNTSWSGITQSEYASNLPLDTDLSAADTILDSYRCGTNGDKIYLSLIYCDENSFMRNSASLIKDSLEKINVIVTPYALSDADYRAKLASGEYDLYLGEIKLPNSMNLSAFFVSGGASSFGIPTDTSLSAQNFLKYLSGEEELDSFLTIFTEDMPFIPVCYRNGQFCYSRKITSTVRASENRLFANISEWVFS